MTFLKRRILRRFYFFLMGLVRIFVLILWLPDMLRIGLGIMAMITLLTNLHTSLQLDVQRLVVLVPDRSFDYAQVGNFIRNAADGRVHRVIYLARFSSFDEESRWMSYLKRLKAVTLDRHHAVDFVLEYETPWTKAVKKVFIPGDAIICFAEHKASWRIFWRKPISEILAEQGISPVYCLS